MSANGETRVGGGTARGTEARRVPDEQQEGSGDDGLHALLQAIAGEAQREGAAAADAIRAEFAIRISDITRHAPRHQQAGIVAALRAQRSALLLALARNTAAEIRGRQRVARAARASARRSGAGQAKPPFGNELARF